MDLAIIFSAVKWVAIFIIGSMAMISGLMLAMQFRFSPPVAVLAACPKTKLPTATFSFLYSPEERHMLDLGLVDIGRSDPRIVVQPAYTSNSNLTGEVLYKDVKRLFLHPAMMEKLSRAQDLLLQTDSTLELVVLDAARPQSVQYRIWEWAVSKGYQKYVASPREGSVHNYGCAVDVTIAGKDSLLDMGTGYDHFGPEAEPRFQYELLKQGKLRQDQIDNRLLLKKVMREAGFHAIQTEWWHFNGVSKEFARANFKVIP